MERPKFNTPLSWQRRKPMSDIVMALKITTRLQQQFPELHTASWFHPTPNQALQRTQQSVMELVTEAEEPIQRVLDFHNDARTDPYAPRMIVDPETTDERSWGWIIYYNSETYVRSRNPKDAVAGNGPFLVNRKSGEMFYTGTTEPIESYVEEYEYQLANRPKSPDGSSADA